MKKSLLTLIAGASLFAGPILGQESEFIKNSPMLNYFADCVGDQNGIASNKERDYMSFKFGNNNLIFICSKNLNGKIGIKNSEIYSNLKDAEIYWQENSISSPMYILEISKNEKVEKVYNFIGTGSKVYLKEPEIKIESIEIK